MKSPIQSALRYFAIFLLVYGSLTGLSLVPGVCSMFNSLYRQPTQPILQVLLPKAYLQMTEEPGNPGMLRTEFASKEAVQQQMSQAGKAGQQAATIQGRNNQVSFYNLFLSFFLLFTALMALSPLPWKQKIVSFLIGTACFYLYTVFKLYLSLLSIFNQKEIAIYHSSAFGLKLAEGILYFMTLGTNALVVLFLWAVLVFRKNNWNTVV